LVIEMDNLSEKVKKLRQAKGWSQEDAARAIGVSLSTFQRWENKGGTPHPRSRRELQCLFDENRIE
jgi:transcriptional regulator with XRE-family HTH domain